MESSGVNILQDPFGRRHDYLRISLTDNCNFRCSYCMPEHFHSFMPAQHLMQASEIFSMAKTFVQLGVKKIRLTGGEPMVRKDFSEILRTLSALDVELLITTNGTRIHHYLDVLKDCGINTLNVSLDSLNPETFREITRRDQFQLVRDNIDLLLENNFRVKINVVAVKKYIKNELIDFINLTNAMPLHVRFIEFMPFSGNKWTNDEVIPAQSLLNMAMQEFDVVKLQDEPHSTARKYKVIGHAGSFAFITSMSNHFCGECNRLRITADGKIKNCLFGKDEVDLLSALRKGDPLYPLIEKSVQLKHFSMGGQFSNGYETIDVRSLENRSMVRIGG